MFSFLLKYIYHVFLYCLIYSPVSSNPQLHIPLPSIVPKAETMDVEETDEVNDLFSPSSPLEPLNHSDIKCESSSENVLDEGYTIYQYIMCLHNKHCCFICIYNMYGL